MNKKDRELVFNKFGGLCAYCGCSLPLKGWHLDHIEPVGRMYENVKHPTEWKWKTVYKGMDNPERDVVDNAYPACAKCNINKHGDSIEEFRKNIARYLASLNTRMVQYQMAKKYGLVVETGVEVKFYFEIHQSQNLTNPNQPCAPSPPNSL